MTTVRTRRYECQRCGACMLVVPLEILPRRFYTWVAAGQTIAVSNLTSSYAESSSGSCDRSTYGVSIAISKVGPQRVVTFSLSGVWPGGAVLLKLPSFRSSGVSSVQRGIYDATTTTVTVTPGTSRVVVTLDT